MAGWWFTCDVVSGGLSQGGARPARWCQHLSVSSRGPYGGQQVLNSPAMEQLTAGNPAVELVDEGEECLGGSVDHCDCNTSISVGWLTVFIVCCIAIFLIVLIFLTTLCVISHRQKQKKKYNFGVKKTKNTVFVLIFLSFLFCYKTIYSTQSKIV